MGICCTGTSTEENKIIDEVNSDISSNRIVVYSKIGCPKCLRIKSLLHSIKANPKIIEMGTILLKNALREITKHRSFPFVFIDGAFIDNHKLESEIKKGNLKLLKKNKEN